MSRTTAPTQDRRLLAGLVLILLMLAACGDGAPKSHGASSGGAGTPAIIPVSTGGTSNVPITSTMGEPVNAPVRYEDAEAAFRAGDYQQAKTMFEGYVTSKPENPFGYYMLGLAAWRSGDFAGAETAFDRSLALDSTSVKSWLNSARVLLDVDRDHEARERVRKALSLDSTSPDGLRLLARVQSRMGETDSAIATYRGVLVRDDHDVWAMNNLGVLYLDQGQSEAALPPLARAVQLKGTSPVFQNNLGIALERTGHIGAAKAAFEAALRADSTYAKASVSLERVSGLIVDSTDVVNLDDLAQEFRLQVGVWRDNARVPEPVPDSAVTTPADSIVRPSE